MTFSQIWNTIEHLFSENSKLAGDANDFFGIDELDEILTKEGMSIRFKKLTNSYEVSFSSPSRLITFTIKKFANTSYQRSEYDLNIKGYLAVEGNAHTPIEDGFSVDLIDKKAWETILKDLGFFTKYVRDWKLKNILEE